ncbi:phosphotransferase family protein [Deinococcus apachensis]|uniref:phosphotransferase family protein n=1 Tax=Deinococcus apachensis TaxID=309886 RepID=UPI0003AB4673|nr:phosphotransferase [Deinococcus apachensis]
MPSSSLSDVWRACFPHGPHPDVAPAGEGDYCRAFLVDHTWLFLFARHSLASECLDRVARVLPLLAEDSPLSIPAVEYHGHLAGLAYVGYRCLPGTELTAGQFEGLPPDARRSLVMALAAFFGHLHAFDPARAAGLGVPVREYPFAMREAELLQGPPEELYRRDLEALAAWPGEHAALLSRLKDALARHLEAIVKSAQPLVLLHGEVSGDHVLHDSRTGRVTGIIDWNGMVVGRPARDFLYLYEQYGREFVTDLLREYGRLPLEDTLRELHFLHVWHTLLRLLWAAEHGDPARGEGLRRRLHALLETSPEA